MSNTAILIGNSDYRSLTNLSCCRDDLLAMRGLLEATGKHAAIEIIEDADADGLKSRIRTAIGDDQRYREVYDLELNCKMQRVQLKITLTPKYHSLRQLVIVVTCAPSLQNCYIFEIGTQHSLTDFGEYSVEGNEVVRRWYKFKWSDNTDAVVTKITAKLDEIVRGHLEQTEQQLTTEET